MDHQPDTATTIEPEQESPSRWQGLKRWLGRAWEALQPGPQVVRGVVIGSLIMSVLLVILFARLIEPGFGLIPDVLISALAWFIAVTLAGLATALLIKIVQWLPRLLSWRGIILIGGSIVGAAAISAFFVLIVPLLVLLAAVIGGSAGAAFGGGLRGAGLSKRIVVAAVLVVSVTALVLAVYTLAERGDDGHLVTPWQEAVEVPQLAAANPALPGSYEVLTVTYGSGTDKHRPEYGEAAELITEPVDGTPFLKGSKGWKVKLRHWYWGFDFESLPLNGRVWYPQGDGPFPLVLVVHGNHRMQEYSDPGYAYLGELLASRGFILVSVDENFLNGGLRNESDCRAWILLQHLQVWQAWSQEQGHRFFGKVDMERIGLIGHSRGGEAVAIAGAFNRLPYYPDDATVELGFDYNIRGIVAIAPCDGQYTPADRPTPLQDLSYLVLQGAYDADVSSYAGIRQLRRLRFTDDQYHFKAGIYSYRANHGQFNTVWGDNDFGWPFGLLLNRKPLLTGEQQRQIGSLYISAFFETTLHDETSYIPLFRDHRQAADWLPEDIFISYFSDTSWRPLCDFEEDVDVSTGSADQVTVSGEHLAVWREQHLKYRKQGSKRNAVVYLGWRAGEDEQSAGDDESATASEDEAASGDETTASPDNEPAEDGWPASYTVSLPEGLAAEWQLTPESLLVLAMAEADETPPEPEAEENGEENGKESSDAAEPEEEPEVEEKADDEADEEEDEPIDLTIELTASDGTVARLALSSQRLLPPVLRSRFTKLPDEGFAYGSDWEPALQTFELPLTAFVEAVPGFDPAGLISIRLVFDRTPEAVIIVDDIGFAERYRAELTE
jgi:dienelactone hydrolase